MINEENAKKYCCEDISKIENYEKAMSDTTQMWCCHHRTEIWWNCSIKDLIENECYYGRKACELIFMTRSEHTRLHKKGELNTNYGRTFSEEMKIKLSEAHKGGHHSDETKRKLSEAQKGRTFSDEHRMKLSESHKGKTFSEESRKKISVAAKAREARRKTGGGY